ncbi:hypothetical protein JD844_031300 [Phrynosoma platyrhinos]|uniref:Roundabout homolog 4 n=1 Tax=Phrynosoma platyrhinos TaxID=52577 RepID=A0ABQ7T155_PHRPL|nr:hypothetical protein JD844_031300 [Phrynosoma platyrhinos]
MSGCFAQEGSKSRSEEFMPQILDHPSDLVVRWDQPATLHCRATGNPPPTIEWYRNGEYVKTNKDDATSQHPLLLDGSLFFLRLSQKKGKSDEGVYNCLARNHLGTAISKNASLYVEVLQEEFRLHPSDLTVTVEERFMLECIPPRGHPEPVISWKKNGVPVSNGRLLVSHALKSDSGTYICMATNQAGERASREAIVSVWEKPTFSRRPNDVQAKLGTSVQFMCGIHGDPTPTVQWHKEDGELPAGRYDVSQESILQIHDLTIDDAGKYICTARNSAGMISAKATLTVEDPLDTGQREQDRSEDALKDLMAARVFLINVTAVPFAPAAHLHWKLIPTSQTKHIEGYIVFYRSLLPVSTHWAEWNVPRDHRTIVAGLERGYTYEFKVQPYSGKAHGLDSNMKHLWIPEEELTVGKMTKTSDLLSSNYILEVVRQPVFIASMGSALWIMLMVLAVYVCQQQARQYSAERQYALGEAVSFDRQSQGSHIQTAPLVPDSRNTSLYGALYVDLPAKDLKTFYDTSLPHPLSSPSLHTVELPRTGDQKLIPRCIQNLRLDNTNVRGGTHKEPLKATSLQSPNLNIQGFWDKSSKKGETKKVLKTNSSPKFSQCHASQNIAGLLLPPPPPVPPGVQEPQDHSTQQECTCTCYLDHPEDQASWQQDKDSQRAGNESQEESQTIPTLPYSRLSAASLSLSLNDDRETVLTPEECSTPIFSGGLKEHCNRLQNDIISATPQTFSSPHTYGYICSPLASELLENDDDDPNMEENRDHSTKFFHGFCQTPLSSLSEDEASLGGSLLNGWGSASEDNGTSTRCSLISSSDGSFLMDANFAQALAVVVDSFCFGMTQREVDKALTG